MIRELLNLIFGNTDNTTDVEAGAYKKAPKKPKAPKKSTKPKKRY